MAYIDGYVFPVPAGNKEKVIEHARFMDQHLIDLGAVRVMECWQDEVSEGKVNDFFTAVHAEEGEKIMFSFAEWPDKETRDAAHKKMPEVMNTPEFKAFFEEAGNDPPFDGKRMIMGGFTPVMVLEKPE